MIASNAYVHDNYLNYYAVMESDVPEEYRKPKIIDQVNKNGLNYLRFKSVLQTFGKRNRNTRLWPGGKGQVNYMKQMMSSKEVKELFQNVGGVPGENGHPVPATGQVTVERILTIDPNNISHIVRQFIWNSDDSQVDGIIETLDEGEGTPGNKFTKNILQGLGASFSVRSLVPQRKNMDGTIDVTGPGRYVCHDRVFIPSHEEAYMDKSVPIKNIVTQSKFETVMESFTSLVLDRSEKTNRILDGMEPVMESAYMNPESGMLTVPVDGGKILLYPEAKYRNELKDFYKNFH